MVPGFRGGLPGVLGFLTQGTLFLSLSALGITSLIAASPTGFFVAKLIGAGFLIFLGLRGWVMAGRPPVLQERPPSSIYFRALAIATINPKSVAGYLAAFSQFVQPGVPIWQQMSVIMPTALTLTALSYAGFTALGAAIGKAALGAVFNIWFRRVMALCFVIYGLLLGLGPPPA